MKLHCEVLGCFLLGMGGFNIFEYAIIHSYFDSGDFYCSALNEYIYEFESEWEIYHVSLYSF